MIPKIIHYCWFGNDEFDDLQSMCIDSWRKYCPDWEIVQWDESNFDVNYNKYTKEAYDSQKWAFVSDVARLFALKKHGGIYLDTDMEVLKPLNDLLDSSFFLGFESVDRVGTGIIGSEENNRLIEKWLLDYDSMSFVCDSGELNTTTNVALVTKSLVQNGLLLDNCEQKINGCTVFPTDYFYPKSPDTGKTTVTDNSCCIHHYQGSWLSFEDKYKCDLRKKLCGFLSFELSSRISRIITVYKFHGMNGAFKYIYKKLKK